MLEFNKYQINMLVHYHLKQAKDIDILFHWMLQKESTYGVHKRDLFLHPLVNLKELLTLQLDVVEHQITKLQNKKGN